jgi:fatty-acyl-CoA synthase
MGTAGTTEWALADVFDIVSKTAPERDAIFWRDRRQTYAETRTRTDALAAFLIARGLGRVGTNPSTPRWECPQDRVALLLHNRPEHLEALIGCWRARVVPFNVNYHYTPGEVATLLRAMGARAAIYERGLGALLDDVAPELDLLIEVDDDSAVESNTRATRFEDAIAAGARNGTGNLAPVHPDDRYLACTGGTTGRPKGVVWRHGDVFLAGMGGAEGMSESTLRERAAAGGGVWFPTSPLMHVAAQWTAMIALNQGATVVLHDDSKQFDMTTILETAARERVTFMTIVGDAYARRMVERLRRGDLDLSQLFVLGTGGAPTSMELKREIHEHLPQVMIRDGYGATEIGAMACATS